MQKRRVALNTESHRQAFNEFADALHAADRLEGWRSSETLRHFLDAGFRALRGHLMAGEQWAANEAEYMKIVALCHQPKETMAAIAAMLGATTAALLAEPIDFIGPVFAELSADAWMGQFFTPHHVSTLMARMTLSDDDLLKDRPFIRCLEPTCGVGGMMLAANLVFRDRGIDPARQVHWHATDIDHRAMCGAYIQLALTDASAYVFRGNSLTLEPPMLASATPAAIAYPKFDRAERAPIPALPAPPAQLEMRL